MDFDQECYDPFEEYKSYGDENSEFNPDDYESDFWEDIIPDADEIADALDRQLEQELYAYDELNEPDFPPYFYDYGPSDSDIESELSRMNDSDDDNPLSL